MRLKYYIRGMGVGIIISTLILTIAFSFKKTTLSDDEIIKRAQALGMVQADAVENSYNADDKATDDENKESNESDSLKSSNKELDEKIEKAKKEQKADSIKSKSKEDVIPKIPSVNDQDSKIDERLQYSKPSEKSAKTDDGNTSSKTVDSAKEDKSAAKEETTDVNGIANLTRQPTKADEFLRNYNKNVSKTPKTKVENYVAFSVPAGSTSRMVSTSLYKKGLIDDSEKFNKYLSSLGVDNLIQGGSFYLSDQSSYDDIVAVLITKQQFRQNVTAPTSTNAN